MLHLIDMDLEDFRKPVGNDLVPKGNTVDRNLARLILSQVEAIESFDRHCGFSNTTSCGNCDAAHHMARFDVAIKTINKIRTQFKKQNRRLL